MREYELIYVIQPDAAAEREQEVHDRVDAAITDGNGVVLVRDDWGKRKLAYEIRKFQKGHYFQLNFLGDGKFVNEVERLLRIDADVLRFLTVLADERVADVPARIAQAKEEAAERARRREERERLEAEREREAAEREAQREREAAQREAGPERQQLAAEGDGTSEEDEDEGAAADLEDGEETGEDDDDTPDAGGDAPREAS